MNNTINVTNINHKVKREWDFSNIIYDFNRSGIRKYNKKYRNFKRFLRVMSPYISVVSKVILFAVVLVAFFSFGQLEHPDTEFLTRLGTSFLQTSLFYTVVKFFKTFAMEVFYYAYDVFTETDEEDEECELIDNEDYYNYN